jgi:hypothetical protein
MCRNRLEPAISFIRTLYEYRNQGKYRVHEFVVRPESLMGYRKSI